MFSRIPYLAPQFQCLVLLCWQYWFPPTFPISCGPVHQVSQLKKSPLPLLRVLKPATSYSTRACFPRWRDDRSSEAMTPGGNCIDPSILIFRPRTVQRLWYRIWIWTIFGQITSQIQLLDNLRKLGGEEYIDVFRLLIFWISSQLHQEHTSLYTVFPLRLSCYLQSSIVKHQSSIITHHSLL